MQQALTDYTDEVAAVRREGLTRALSGEQIEQFFALGFALEQLQRNFRDLAMRLNERVPSKPAADAAPAAD